MNVGLWLKKAKTKIDSLDAELILLTIFGEKDRTFLLTHEEMDLSGAKLALLDWFVERRQAGVPVAYLASKKEFYGREFYVNEAVLVPRPESETIVELAKELFESGELVKKNVAPKILDVGTGSGILAVSLALEIPRARVTGSDVSRLALQVAARNAVNLGARVDFLESDLLEVFPKDENFDLIVANLPYVDVSWSWKSKELAWEPAEALYAGDGGLEIIKKFMEQARGRAKFIILECDTCQQEAIIEFSKNLGYDFVETRGFQSVFSWKS